MDTQGIIWLVVAVVLLAILVVVAIVLTRRGRERRIDQRRGQADELRHQAADQTADVRRSEQRAEEAETAAERARQRAERAEGEAVEARRKASYDQAQQEEAIREADRIDPRVDEQAADYRPTTDPRALKDPLTEPEPGTREA